MPAISFHQEIERRLRQSDVDWTFLRAIDFATNTLAWADQIRGGVVRLPYGRAADRVPVEPVESFLTHLSALERSPSTPRAYATSVKLWFEFPETVGVNWAEVRVDGVGRFVSWLLMRASRLAARPQ